MSSILSNASTVVRTALVSTRFSALLLTLSLLSSTPNLKAIGQRIDRLRFDPAPASEGLSNSSVTSLAQDRFGFLWVGTADGLNRYDGIEFRTYHARGDAVGSFRDNYIAGLHNDQQGTLWVVTARGLSRYVVAGDRFVAYLPGGEDTPISGVAEYSDGRLLIASEGGFVFEYDRDSDEFVTVSDRFAFPIKALLIDRQDRVWIGSRDGLARLDEDYQVVESVPLPSADRGRESTWVATIVEDRRGRLVYGVYGGGVLRYLPGSGTSEPVSERKIWDGVVGEIMVDESGNIYVGSTGGLSVVEADTGEVFTYAYSRFAPRSIQDGTINALLSDEEGNLWVGASRGGLSAAFNRKAFHMLSPSLDDPASPTKESVNALLVDSQDRLWIGYHNDGLDMIVESEGRKVYYDPTTQEPGSLGIGSIYDLHEDSQGAIWVGSNWSGLQKLDPETGKVSSFLPDEEDPTAIAGADVRRIEVDGEGNFWLALHGVGVGYYDRETEVFSKLDAYPHLWVEDLALDDAGGLWIASSEGLSYRTPDGARILAYQSGNDGLSDRHVTCILIDANGYVWAGSANGLNRISRERGTIDRFNQADGLPSSHIRSLLLDDSGNLWVGTSRGLAKFDRTGRGFTSYGVADGLESSDMLARAAFKMDDGRLMFGSEKGVVRFQPSEIRPNSYIPPVVITGVRLFSERLAIQEGPDGVLKESTLVVDELIFPPGMRSFALEFAALSYVAPESNRYAYRLLGFEQEWMESGGQRSVSYTNIPPGRYQFQVKAGNADGLWNDSIRSVAVVVEPFYWQTRWFKFALGLIVVVALLGLYAVRMRRVVAHRAALEQAVADRTRLLQDALVEVEAQKGQIEEQNLELRDHRENLEELIAQRTWDLEQAKVKAEESERLKTAFLANVSHEIRTPMNAILGFSSLMNHQQVSDEERRQYSAIIERNGKALLVLIDDILDLSRLQSDVVALERARVDVGEVFNDLKVYFQEVVGSEREGVSIAFECNHKADTRVVVWSDEARLRQIVNNLLDNALKFTERGEVRFGYRIEESPGSTSVLHIHVQDTGVGIPEEDVPTIFNRFRKVESPRQKLYRGTGLGLAIVWNLVTLMGGAIEVDSKVGEGTRFRVRIPVEPVL